MATQKAVPNEKDLYIDPKTGIYYGQVYVITSNGERFRKMRSLKVKDVKKARIELRKLMNRLLAENPKRKIKKLFIDEWLDWLALGKISRWRIGTYNDIESKGRLHLEPFFKNYALDNIDEHAWEEYIADKWSTDPGLKMKLHGRYLSMFLHHAKRKGLIDSVPRFRNPDGLFEGGKRFSKAEQRRLLGKSRKNKPLQLQVLMGLKMGMRKNEILKLKKDRIDWAGGVIRLSKDDTKTKKSRTIPIPEIVRPRLRNQFESSESLYLFPSSESLDRPQGTNKTAWKTLKTNAKVKGRFHDLRHTCASEMADRGVQTVIAAKILGMSAVIFEKVYCKPSEDAMKRALE